MYMKQARSTLLPAAAPPLVQKANAAARQHKAADPHAAAALGLGGCAGDPSAPQLYLLLLIVVLLIVSF